VAPASRRCGGCTRAAAFQTAFSAACLWNENPFLFPVISNDAAIFASAMLAPRQTRLYRPGPDLFCRRVHSTRPRVNYAPRTPPGRRGFGFEPAALPRRQHPALTDCAKGRLMEPQTKRTLLATFLCLLVLFGWMRLQAHLSPPPTSQPAVTGPAEVASGQPAERTAPPTSAVGVAQSPSAVTTTPPASQQDRAPGYVVPDAPSRKTVTLGDARHDNAKAGFTNPYEMSVVVTPRGGGVESVYLSRHRKSPPKDKKNPQDDPYPLLLPIDDLVSGETFTSFVTESIRLVQEKALVPLDNAVWSLRKEPDQAGEKAVLQTRLRRTAAQSPSAGDTDILEITKTYFLPKNSPLLRMTLSVRNLTPSQHGIVVAERGPLGIQAIDPDKDYRRVVAAVIDEETEKKVTNASSPTRTDILKAEDSRLELLPGEGRQRLWAAVGNKYFACIVAPLAGEPGKKYPDYLGQVFAKALLKDRKPADDMTLEQVFKPKKLLEPSGTPGDTVTWEIEAYCGAKDTNVFDILPAEARSRHYELVSAPDGSSCTFEPLPTVMRWLLTNTYRVVHNYGISIIILVIIVRLVLHPISRRGQGNMIKMQKGMARLKPKLEAVQQQYKNDKARLSEEMRKVYAEEGINPATQFLGCLPMFLQMPIWVALWATLNSDVHLRHQPFCLWITDLSSPDALIPFASPFNIPLLSGLMGPIYALNLLPIIMTVTMYAQQKLTQKMTKAPPAPPKLDKDGRPLPDQMAQQQKMMNFMTLFFGLLFYNFPSGLNLYILSSNLLGMLEQYIIKRDLRLKEERGELFVKKEPKPGGKPSLFSRYAGAIQKKVEQARQIQSDRPRQDPGKRGDKPRS
jgi:YidC/Oxa1 family membrane protein insertase